MRGGENRRVRQTFTERRQPLRIHEISASQHKLYTVPPDQRAQVRQRAAAWRRYQRARARLLQQMTALLALADQLAEYQRVDWPP